MAKRILLVDDTAVYLRTMQSCIKQQTGCEVVAAANAAEGRDLILRDGGFNLVISDFQMPGEDGISFLTYLCNLEKSGKIRPHKRILMSGDSFKNEVIDKALADQVFHQFIPKNKGIDEILERIQKLLSSK
jgi:DNA-binding NarL/FixJ family response regulator